MSIFVNFECALEMGFVNVLLIASLSFFSLIVVDSSEEAESEGKPPNVLIFVVDDLGIGDLGCYGNVSIKTPHINRLSEEGVQLEHHLAAAPLCTPSRAAFLTGRYPARFGLEGDPESPPVIVHVGSRVGLPEDETTIAEAFSSLGYSTALIGKWHLGSSCEWLGRNCVGPLKHGFDYFYGLPLTLIPDQEGNHPFWVFNLDDPFYQVFLMTMLLTTASSLWLVSVKGVKASAVFNLGAIIVIHVVVWFLYTHYRLHTPKWWQVSPWMNKHCNGVVMRKTEVEHQSVPFETLFEDLVTESVEFIHSSATRTRRRPFLLVHSFAHVHTPLFSSEAFSGRSNHGRYGDNVEEMDSGVGRILQALQEENIEEDTIVYFTSDHGGHVEAVSLSDGQRTGGHNQQFKGGKGMGASEGGIRVPGIFRWKGKLLPGSHINSPTSLLDIFPTLLDLAGLPPVAEIVNTTKELDGISFGSLLRNPNQKLSGKRFLIHHCGKDIHGLRLAADEKVYKIHFYLPGWEPNSTQCGFGVDVLCSCSKGLVNLFDRPLLFELTSDPFEDRPILEHTEMYDVVVSEFNSFLREWRERVIYPPSRLLSKWDVVLLPWLQPLNIWSF